MKKILILLLPIAVLALGVTYAGFKDTLYIGGTGIISPPNTVKTGTLEWKVYLPSELRWQIPDILDGIYVPNSIPPYLIPEYPDVASASITKSEDTVSITLTKVYPGYGAVAHFVYVNEGTIPSKLRNVNITIDDPYGIADNITTDVILVYSVNGSSPYIGYGFIGFPLKDLPLLIEQALDGVIFEPGGEIAFCKPNGTNVTIKEVIINPNSGLPPEMIEALNNTDSFWIIVPPNSTPPQGAWLRFNLTLTFGQFNEVYH